MESPTPHRVAISDPELLEFLADVRQTCPDDHPELTELCGWAQSLIDEGVFDAEYNRKPTWKAVRLSVRGTRQGSVVQVNHESTGEHVFLKTSTRKAFMTQAPSLVDDIERLTNVSVGKEIKPWDSRTLAALAEIFGRLQTAERQPQSRQSDPRASPPLEKGHTLSDGRHHHSSLTPSRAVSADRRPRDFDPSAVPTAPIRRAAHARVEETLVLLEKAVRGHHDLLVVLHQALTDAGWQAIEEISTAIDLRGRPTDSAPTMIFEAKTLGTRRETPRIRSGLAQLLEYRFLHGTQNDELCLVLSRQISDERIRFLRAIGIDTIWLDDGRFLAGEAPLSDALRAIATVS